MKDLIKNKKYAYMVALFCMLLWGSAFPVLKISYQELNMLPEDNMSRMYFAGIRFLLAGLLVLVYSLAFKRQEIKESKIDWKFLIFLGFLQTTLQYLFFYIAVANTSGVKSSILQSASTFLVVIFSHFAFKDDKMSKNKVYALIFGFLGILIANLDKGFDLSFKLQGEVFMLISSTLGALGTIVVKKYGKDMSPFVLTSAQMIIGSIILIVVGRWGMTAPLAFTAKAYGLLLYSAFLSALAFVLWYQLLQNYKAGEISVLRLFIPMFGAILSTIFLKESMTINLVLGLILVIIGIYVLNRPAKRPVDRLG